jgi:deoxyxylulose-5-phosphate synthase
VRCLALPDHPIEHGDPAKQRAEAGLDGAGMARALRELAQAR